jgi:hypothetical protein
MTSTRETHQTNARRDFLFVFVCLSASALCVADEVTGNRSTGIVFKQLQDTGLNEVLKARRSVLEKRNGGPLRGHAWWLWGLSAFDYDQDGDLDLIVCIHGGKNGLIIKNLWKETGKFRFVDVTEELGVDGIMPSTDDYPLVWDFDGDGDLDIAGLLDDQPTPCLLNQSGKRFVKASFSLHPINHPGGVRDLNGDGYLDIFQLRRGKRIEFSYDPESAVFKKSESTFEPEFELPTEVNRAIATLRDRKENRFIRFKYINDYDLNNDGKRDLVVSGFGSYSGDRVGWYLTATEDNRFVDETTAMGLPRQGTPFHFQDVDQDGDVDLLIASGERAGLYLNNGRGGFTLRPGPLAEFIQRRCPYLHVAFRVDLDNDGDHDLALSNRRYGQQRVFENLGDGRFEVVLQSRGWDADPLVLRDINDDGRVDVIIGGAGDKEDIGIFINETRSAGTYCKLYPRMKSPNIYAVGTRVEIYSAGSLGKKDAQPRSTETAPLDGSSIHIGLGKERTFDMRVIFPGRPLREFRNVNAVPTLRVTPVGKLVPYE